VLNVFNVIGASTGERFV